MANDVQTLVNVQMSQTSFDYRYQAALDVARSCLEGYYGDYLFFSYDGDTWVLLKDFDNAVYIQGGYLTADSCTCIMISSAIGQYTETLQDFRLQGTLIGTEEQAINATISGKVPNSQYRIRYGVDTFTSVSVSNPHGYLFYSSYEDTPHLIEGGQNYAYAAFLLAIGVIAFKLADRLFRRIY